LDGKNTIFAFSAVIATEDEVGFEILVEVINNGQLICHRSCLISYGYKLCSDHVWLNFHHSHQSQLKTDNLRVEFSCDNRSKSVFFKSCGFHIEHKYEEEAMDLIDDIQLAETP
jgi:hypothetical protein